MYIKIVELNSHSGAKDLGHLFECDSVHAEHLRVRDAIRPEYWTQVTQCIGPYPSATELTENPKRGDDVVIHLVLRRDDSTLTKELMVFRPARAYVMNDQGRTIDIMHGG